MLDRLSKSLVRGAPPKVKRAVFHGNNRWLTAALLEMALSDPRVVA